MSRLKRFLSEHAPPENNTAHPEALQAYPTLTWLVQGIPQKKLSEWNDSDEYYHDRFQEIRLCLHGLIGHGACLAAQKEMESLPELRNFIGGLAAFWPDPHEETDDPVERETKYTKLFDKAVAKAQSKEDVPSLSKERRKNILIGLENYILDVSMQGEMDYALTECEHIAAQIRQSWQQEGQLQAWQFSQTLG